MVIYTSQLKSEGDGLAELLKEPTHVRLNRVQALDFLVIIHEHVTVDFVDEDLVPYVRLDLAGLLDHFKELLARALIVSVMSVNHINEGATVGNMLHRVALKHVVPREVNDVELNVVVVADGLSLYVAGR